MFFLEIVFGFHIGITVLNHFIKTFDNLLNLALCEFGTNPDDETGYFGHMVFPLRCLPIDYLFNKKEASPFEWIIFGIRRQITMSTHADELPTAVPAWLWMGRRHGCG